MKKTGSWILMTLIFVAGAVHASFKEMHDLAKDRVVLEAQQAYSKYTDFIVRENVPMQGYLSRSDEFLTYSLYTSSAILPTQTVPCFSFEVQMGVKDLLGKFEEQEKMGREVCVMGAEVVDKNKVPDLQTVPVLFYRNFQCTGQESGIMKNAKHSFKISSLNLESEKPEQMRFLEEYYADGKFKFVVPKYCRMNFVQGLLECEYSADGNNGRLDLDLKNYKQERNFLCDVFNGAGCVITSFFGKIKFGRAKADVVCQ